MHCLIFHILHTFTHNKPQISPFVSNGIAGILLTEAQQNGELRQGINLPLSLSFVHRLVLSTLQHIGLLSAREFRNQKDELQDYIDEIINMLRTYLSDSSVRYPFHESASGLQL